LTEPNLHSTERLGILDEAANVIIESSATSVTGALDLRKIETLLKLTASDLSVDQGERQDFLGNPMPAVTEDDLQAWRSGLLSKIAKANDRLGLPALASEQFRRVIGMLEEQGKLKQDCKSTGNTVPVESNDMLAVGALTELKLLAASIAPQCRLQLVRVIGRELKRLGNVPSAMAMMKLLPGNLQSLYLEEVIIGDADYSAELLKKIYK
jgi:hypothetical protein